MTNYANMVGSAYLHCQDVTKLNDTSEVRIWIIFGWAIIISDYSIFSSVIISLFEFQISS